MTRRTVISANFIKPNGVKDFDAIMFSLQCRALVAEKIVQRFDVVKVPR